MSNYLRICSRKCRHIWSLLVNKLRKISELNNVLVRQQSNLTISVDNIDTNPGLNIEHNIIFHIKTCTGLWNIKTDNQCFPPSYQYILKYTHLNCSSKHQNVWCLKSYLATLTYKVNPLDSEIYYLKSDRNRNFLSKVNTSLGHFPSSFQISMNHKIVGRRRLWQWENVKTCQR